MLKLIGRYWHVTLGMLLLVVIGVVLVGQSVNPQYRGNARIILLPADAEAPVENPLSRSGSTERLAASAVLTVMKGPDYESRAEDQGLRGEWDVDFLPSEGAIVEITATGDNSEEAVGNTNLLIQLFSDELERIQNDVGTPEGGRTQVQILSSSDSAIPEYGSRIRVMIATGILGLALATLVPIIVDLVLRRSDSEQQAAPAGGGPQSFTQSTAGYAPGNSRPEQPRPTEGAPTRYLRKGPPNWS